MRSSSKLKFPMSKPSALFDDEPFDAASPVPLLCSSSFLRPTSGGAPPSKSSGIFSRSDRELSNSTASPTSIPPRMWTGGGGRAQSIDGRYLGKGNRGLSVGLWEDTEDFFTGFLFGNFPGRLESCRGKIAILLSRPWCVFLCFWRKNIRWTREHLDRFVICNTCKKLNA